LTSPPLSSIRFFAFWSKLLLRKADAVPKEPCTPTDVFFPSPNASVPATFFPPLPPKALVPCCVAGTSSYLHWRNMEGPFFFNLPVSFFLGFFLSPPAGHTTTSPHGLGKESRLFRSMNASVVVLHLVRSGSPLSASCVTYVPLFGINSSPPQNPFHPYDCWYHLLIFLLQFGFVPQLAPNLCALFQIRCLHMANPSVLYILLHYRRVPIGAPQCSCVLLCRTMVRGSHVPH